MAWDSWTGINNGWAERSHYLACVLPVFPSIPRKILFALPCSGLNRLSTPGTFISILTWLCPCQFSINLPSLQLTIWLSNTSCWSHNSWHQNSLYEMPISWKFCYLKDFFPSHESCEPNRKLRTHSILKIIIKRMQRRKNIWKLDFSIIILKYQCL